MLLFCNHHDSMAEVIVVTPNTGFPRKCGPTLIGSESREAFLNTERVSGNVTDRPQVAADCHRLPLRCHYLPGSCCLSSKSILPIGVSMENIVMVFSSERGLIEWPKAYRKACRGSLCPQCYMVVQHTLITLLAHNPNVPIWQYFELNSILI